MSIEEVDSEKRVPCILHWKVVLWVKAVYRGVALGGGIGRERVFPITAKVGHVVVRAVDTRLFPVQ